MSQPRGTISCQGKVGFDSAPLAHEAAARRKGRKPYRCKFCGKWHVSGDNHGKDMRRGEKIRNWHGSGEMTEHRGRGG